MCTPWRGHDEDNARSLFTLNEFPIAVRDPGNSEDVVDIVEDHFPRRFRVLAQRVPHIHTVDGQIRWISTGSC